MNLSLNGDEKCTTLAKSTSQPLRSEASTGQLKLSETDFEGDRLMIHSSG